MIKKIIVRLLIVLLVLIVVAGIAVHFFLDSAVKRAVETIGPGLTKVQVKLDAVNIVLLSESGSLKGLLVGNPTGYKTPSAISVGTASLALQPSSLLSDKIVIRSINVQAPEITFETDLMHNNLSKILSNLEETSGGGKDPTQTKDGKPAKKFQVDDFVINGGKIHVTVSTLGKSATAALPQIHLKDLGKDPEGITVAELSKKILQAIESASVEASKNAIADLSKGAVYLSTDAIKGGTNTVEKVTRGLRDFIPGKK